jgi:hypothetical protein
METLERFMDVLYQWIVRWHAAVSFVGLVAFWIPVFARKGGRTHISFGRVFVLCAYVGVALAGLSITYRLIKPFGPGGAPDELSPSRQAEVASMVRGSRIFLAYLAVITLALVRQGVRAVQTKDDPEAMRTPLHIGLVYGAMGAGLVVLITALATDIPQRGLFLALSPLGPWIGWDMLRFIRNPRPTRMAWWYEHMGAMLGAGIAFHTAFAVFGARQLFGLKPSGALGVIPWIAPALIGIPISRRWIRYYKRKFGEQSAPEGATDGVGRQGNWANSGRASNSSDQDLIHRPQSARPTELGSLSSLPEADWRVPADERH